MEPLVSICTTTYQHRRYIRQTLDSFLSQKTDFPFEILVHDDCSGDGTVEILEEYADPNSEKYEKMVEEIRRRQNFTSLRFHRLDDMLESIGIDPCKVCTYCFNGKE